MGVTTIWARIFSVWFKTAIPLSGFYLGLTVLLYLSGSIVDQSGMGLCFGSMFVLGGYLAHLLALYAGFGAVDQYLLDGELNLAGNWNLAFQKFWQLFFGSLVVFGLTVGAFWGGDYLYGEFGALAGVVVASCFAVLYVPALLLEAGGPLSTVLYTVQLFFKKPVGVVGTMVVYVCVVVAAFVPLVFIEMAGVEGPTIVVAAALAMAVYWSFSWVTGTVLYRTLFTEKFNFNSAKGITSRPGKKDSGKSMSREVGPGHRSPEPEAD